MEDAVRHDTIGDHDLEVEAVFCHDGILNDLAACRKCESGNRVRGVPSTYVDSISSLH